MKVVNYDEHYNLRLRTTDKEAFFALKDELKLGPGDCLAELMRYYKQGHKELQEHKQIILTMQSRADGGRASKLRKIIFSGSEKYIETDPPCRHLDFKTAKELKRDFDLQINLQDVDTYWFVTALDAYWHDEKACFLVRERLDVYVILEQVDQEDIAVGKISEHPLSVKRCAFINDYDQLCCKFGKYASASSLGVLAPIMAKDIGKNYLLMDELF